MYKPTIGLEVHAELKTNTKMFCGCKNAPHNSIPNEHICPVCLAHPGTLPVANKEAIHALVRFGVAVNGTIATYTEFDRKNYFYPDIPKAYQISQYAFPFVQGGVLAGVTLTRVHLEEDTARSQHDKGEGSLVDFNRAGVPLLELVTEPVIHSAAEAVAFATELQLVLRTIGISDANMELGEMRVEANISVSSTETLGTKVEVKNLNSFRSVGQAIEFEIKRHIEALERGEEIAQETRGWDEAKGVTFLQRSKETAKDYRYFPDPDLPKMDLRRISEFQADVVRKTLPELPTEKRVKYSYLGLTNNQIEQLLANKVVDEYFRKLEQMPGATASILVTAVNYLLTDVVPIMGNGLAISAESFYCLMEAVYTKKIGSRVAKDLIIEFVPQNIDVAFATVLSDRGLLGGMSEADVNALCRQVIEAHPTVVTEYRAGKTAAIQFLIGQVMKETKGKSNPTQVAEVFKTMLE
jgi:aspartyl-tRNA(Asn)/glutamyl-tRNA(Gln) amidotransferase subunit B